MSRPLSFRMISLVVTLLAACASGAWANVVIDTITVGDPGNAGEWSGAGAGGYGSDRVCGAVGYAYNIGKYEVSAGQYTAFLNAVGGVDTYSLYNIGMSSLGYGCGITQSGAGTPNQPYTYSVAADFANRPVMYVGYWDACRFSNWLHNGQPSGTQNASTTEDGAYTLNGYTGYGGSEIQRNPGWQWAVTSEDEWYKTAYYKGGSTNAGYWDYPTGSDFSPGRDMDDLSGNNANYSSGFPPYPIDGSHFMTLGGEFQNSDSPYGAFDQGGNVWEWNEALADPEASITQRGVRGGSYHHDRVNMQASCRNYFLYPTNEVDNIGFRVSRIPEPATIVMMLLSIAGIMRRRT
jgi:formylglycine-generating enzyme